MGPHVDPKLLELMIPTNRLQDVVGKLAEVKLLEFPLPQGKDLEEVAANLVDRPYTMFLHSGGDLDCSRFSFLGFDPYLVIRAKGRRVEVTDFHKTYFCDANPFDILEEVLSSLRISPMDSHLPFYCGAMGYLAYDLKNHLEELPQVCRNELELPELLMALPRFVLAYDRIRHENYLAVTDHQHNIHRVHPGHEQSLDALREIISGRARSPLSYQAGGEGFYSNFTRPAYLEAVRKVKHYIRQGDVYQVNLSQRFSTSFSGDSFRLFLDLFERNPAPFFAYLNLADHVILSTSPERFIFQDGPYVETRPIKGTRPRGNTTAEDTALERELTTSSKDEAELSMIVDLLRNDLGKVCAPRSVRVSDHKRVEAYTNVFHLVSIVEGELRTGCSQVDLIKAVFPGGSITGCPKIRAMEIIEELEPDVRSIYTGSIGYISVHDTMDLNIAIRTAIIKDGSLFFSVGGGIVYDSDEEEEYLETLHKARTLMEFLGDLSEEQKDVRVFER
jgi:para-aminobenzoate synthetase component 1